MEPTIAKYSEHILNAFNDGLYITDPAGKTLWINRMYEELTGLSADRLIGHNVRDLVEKGVFDEVLNPEIVATGKPLTHAQRLSNGKNLVLSGYPVYDESGKIRLVVTFVRDITRLTEMTENMTAQRNLIEQLSDNIAYQAQRQSKNMAPVYASEQMNAVIGLVEKVAASEASLLILGETGTGKDVLAHLAHDKSPRKDKMFLKVDCGGLTESLTESELFGYVAGAFTGAGSKGKAGYFEMANGGTVFLDEVGELSLTMQSRLLRVLQDHEIIRVGDTKPRRVDVRVIAATNRDLNALVKEGLFRRDLFYRLNETTVHIPPLRERPKDIGPLTEHFFAMYTAKYRKSMSLAQDVLDVFHSYGWPGNIRQLQNVMHNLIITHNPGILHAGDLPPEIAGTPAALPPENAAVSTARNATADPHGEIVRFMAETDDKPIPLKELTAAFERKVLNDALRKYGSMKRVAQAYGIDRTTMFRKLRTPRTKEP